MAVEREGLKDAHQRARAAHERARAARTTTSPSWSTRPPRCSRRSPPRTATCRATVAQAAGRAARDHGDARRRASASPTSSGRRRTRCCRPSARSTATNASSRPIARDAHARSSATQVRPVRARGAPARRRPAARRAAAWPARCPTSSAASCASTRCSTCSASTRTAPRPQGRRRPPGGLPVLAGLADAPDGEPHQRRRRQRPDAPGVPDRHLPDHHRPRQRGAARSSSCSASPALLAEQCNNPPTTSLRPAARAQPASCRQSAQEAGSAVKHARHDPRPARGDGDLRLLLLRPAAVPVAVLRRARAAQAEGLPLRRLVPRGDHARRRGRRPRLRRVAWARSSQLERDPAGNRTLATIELDRAYAPGQQGRAGDPAPEDAARRDLRRADARRPRAPSRSPRTASSTNARGRADGRARRGARALPAARPATDFQRWQANSAEAIEGRGQDLNDALGNIAGFADDGADLLDGARTATPRRCSRWSRNTGSVFEALTRDEDAAARVHRRLLDLAAGDGVRSARRWPSPSRSSRPSCASRGRRSRGWRRFAARHQAADRRPRPGGARPAPRRSPTCAATAPGPATLLHARCPR